MNSWAYIASQLLLHSIWQVLLVAFLLWGSLKFIPKANARLRYAAALAGLYLIPVISVLTAIHVIQTASDTSIPSAPGSSGPIMLGILVIWLIGFIVATVRLGIDSVAVHRLASSEREPVSEGIAAMLYELTGRLGIDCHVRIGISHHVTAPCTLSFWKPLILIPVGCLTRLNPDEMEAIIAHELAHIKRLDFLHRFVQSLLEAIYYYHPMLAYISKQVSIEREHACDDMATSIIANPKPLATGLLKTGLLRAENQLVLAAGSQKIEALETRVGRLVALEQSKHAVPRYQEVRSRLLPCLAFILLTFGMWGIAEPIIAKTETIAIDRVLLVGLKDDVCDQLYLDNIYWNPTYDQGGPAMIHVAVDQIHMNGAPLPKKTQNRIRAMFKKRGLLTDQDVRLRFYGDDIKLVLTPIKEGDDAESQIYRLTNGNDTVRSFRMHVTFAA